MANTFLICGAGGYIGSVMVQDLLKEGHKVIAVDRFFFGDVLNDVENRNLKIVKSDTRLLTVDLFKNVDVVIDLASLSNDASSDLDPSLTRSININGPVNVANCAKKAGVKKYIFSSSCSVYGASNLVLTERSVTKPVSLYGKSKIAAEKELLKLTSKNFGVTILRNGTVYGLSRKRMRFDLVVNIMTLTAFYKNMILISGGGTQWRPLVHIKDVVKAFQMVAFEKDLEKIQGEVFNVGSNDQNYQICQLANIFRPHFPNLAVEETRDEPDPRNYRVSFDKITKTLGYHNDFTVSEGILEIKNALKKGEISDSPITNTAKYYRYLINADKLLTTVKLNGKLFEI